MKKLGLDSFKLASDVYDMSTRVVRTTRGLFVGKKVLHPELAKLHLEFFEQNTQTFSGQTTETRNLCVPHHVLHCRLNASTPSLLRDLHDRDPSIAAVAEKAILANKSLQLASNEGILLLLTRNIR